MDTTNNNIPTPSLQRIDNQGNINLENLDQNEINRLSELNKSLVVTEVN